MKTVDDYIAAFPEDQAARLREMRTLVTTALPQAVEEIKWGVPAYSTGTVLVTFAGFAKHLNLYFTPSTVSAFEHALSDYRTGKSAVSFPYDRPLPERLIADLLAHRLNEYTTDGITWM
ncbi:DUF1801 domain-containing protein [Nonomuraea sp. NPDC046802]|uniref:iron chaperone n=1 Tax=Nonomuraea sp. NPDC046802 TaxID=3154919 RepID=UPI0033C6B72F